jgi:hypothetical protein
MPYVLTVLLFYGMDNFEYNTVRHRYRPHNGIGQVRINLTGAAYGNDIQPNEYILSQEESPLLVLQLC